MRRQSRVFHARTSATHSVNASSIFSNDGSTELAFLDGSLRWGFAEEADGLQAAERA
jgi:hypothetical protein